MASGVMRQRIAEAVHKASAIRDESWGQALAILEKERGRLESFQRSVNVLFVPHQSLFDKIS